MKSVLSALVISLVFSTLAISTSAAETATSTGTTRKETAREKLEQRKETVKEKKEERKEKARDKIENLKANAASREAALRTKLAKFKDQKKVERVERINENLNKISKKQTDSMTKFLENARRILDKLQARVTEESTKGKDVTAVNSAIAEAKTKIASASTAVSAQAGSDYTISVSSEATAKTEITATRDNLHTDLQAARKLVIEAKQAVGNAITVAKSTLGGFNGL